MNDEGKMMCGRKYEQDIQQICAKLTPFYETHFAFDASAGTDNILQIAKALIERDGLSQYVDANSSGTIEGHVETGMIPTPKEEVCELCGRQVVQGLCLKLKIHVMRELMMHQCGNTVEQSEESAASDYAQSILKIYDRPFPVMTPVKCANPLPLDKCLLGGCYACSLHSYSIGANKYLRDCLEANMAHVETIRDPNPDRLSEAAFASMKKSNLKAWEYTKKLEADMDRYGCWPQSEVEDFIYSRQEECWEVDTAQSEDAKDLHLLQWLRHLLVQLQMPQSVVAVAVGLNGTVLRTNAAEAGVIGVDLQVP